MKLDMKRVRYLGYWKFAPLIDPKRARTHSRTIDVGFKDGLPSGGLSWQNAIDLSLLGVPAFIRTQAPGILKDLEPQIVPVTSTSGFVSGGLYEFHGPTLFAVLHHDDFREDSGEPRPRLAAWLTEFMNEDQESVTWLLLHGTADGNIEEYSMGAMPSTRAGSGTESFFESLFADAHESSLQREKRLTPFWQAHATYSMMYDADPVPAVETVFRCSKVLDLSQFDPEVESQILSLRFRSDTSPGVPVTRLVIGSPFVVQVQARTVERRGSIFSRWMSQLFGRIPGFRGLVRGSRATENRPGELTAHDRTSVW